MINIEKVKDLSDRDSQNIEYTNPFRIKEADFILIYVEPDLSYVRSVLHSIHNHVPDHYIQFPS